MEVIRKLHRERTDPGIAAFEESTGCQNHARALRHLDCAKMCQELGQPSLQACEGSMCSSHATEQCHVLLYVSPASGIASLDATSSGVSESAKTAASGKTTPSNSSS
mmetsp:Transcript_36019/g.84463  ORF Transcript_36019/g.84463 Transcript_36019/m.84463 type:complete len:107 (-) Transcript_36019:628-948(-)